MKLRSAKITPIKAGQGFAACLMDCFRRLS
nr:MAG TPA: MepB protein [Caudoviricetes sp.]